MQEGKHHLTLRGLESACAREKLEIVFNINNHNGGGVGVGVKMGVGGWRQGVSALGEVGRGEKFLRQS